MFDRKSLLRCLGRSCYRRSIAFWKAQKFPCSARLLKIDYKKDREGRNRKILFARETH